MHKDDTIEKSSVKTVKEPQKKLIRRHLQAIVKESRGLLIVALFFAMATLIAFVVQSYYVASLFDHLLHVWIDKIPLDTRLCRKYLLGIAAMVFLRPLFQWGREWISQQASTIARTRLQQKLLRIIIQLGPESNVFGSDGVLSTKLVEQVDALDAFISRYYVQMMMVGLTPVVILFVLVWHSLVATVIFLLSVPLIILFMILVGISAANKSREQFDALASLSGYFLDLIRGIKTIVHLDVAHQAKKIIDDTSERYRKGTMEVLALAFLSIGTLEFFSTLSIAMVALYLGLGLMGEFPGYPHIILVPYRSALLILLLAPEFYAPLRLLGNDYHAKAAAEGAVAELIPILQYEAWIHPGKEIKIFNQAPAIEAKDISIKTKEGNFRLAPLSFSINGGERVHIKGSSGSGKSSLLKALLTFVPYEGELLIDDIPLRHLERNSWLDNIGYLSQSPSNIPDTIAANLRLAKPNASDEELMTALDEVGLADLVRHLPMGLETPLGERGLGLSGGQLGRLAIAQLLLREALVWLLDEPTEHLDDETSKLILVLLEKVTRGKTVILVTHQDQYLSWLNKTIDIA